MAAELKELKRLSEGSASAQATEEAERALLAFKEALCDYESLPPNTAVTSNSKGERKTAMQGYEYACILAAKNILKGESALERHVHLLSPFYWDYRQELGDSPKRGEILGLELLSLLVGKQLGDFYCLLERIPLNERTVKCIDYVVSLEKHLMEGNYNQLLKMRQKSPSSLYKSLLNNLEATIQDEVASCIEQSYPSISVESAAKLMNVKPDDVLKYANDKELWKIKNGIISK